MPSASSFLDERPSASSFLDENDPDAPYNEEGPFGPGTPVPNPAPGPPSERSISSSISNWKSQADAPSFKAISPTEHNIRTVMEKLPFVKTQEENLADIKLGLAAGQPNSPYLSMDEAQIVEAAPGLAGRVYGMTVPPKHPAEQLTTEQAQSLFGVGETTGGVIAGTQNAAAQLTDFFRTPLGIATIMSGGVVGGAGASSAALPASIAGRIQAGGFAADMLNHSPEQAMQLVQAIESGDPRAITSAGVNLAGTGFFLLGLGRHAADPKLPQIPLENSVEGGPFPRLPDVDTITRNRATPGTVGRASERMEWAPTVPEPPAGMVSAGRLPFDSMRRFGDFKVPEPQMLEVPIEANVRAELSAGGKASFAREQLNNAIEGAEAQGMGKTAEALRVADRRAAADQIIRADEAAKTPVADPVVETASEAVPRPAPAEPVLVAAAPEAATPAVTAQRLTPVLETASGKRFPGASHKAALQSASDSMKRGKITPDEFMEVFDAMENDAQHKFETADGKVLTRSEAGELTGLGGNLQSEQLRDAGLLSDRALGRQAAAPEPVEAPASVRLYQGQEGGSGGGSFWSENPQRARSYGKNVVSVEVPADVAAAAKAAREAGGTGTGGDYVLPNEWANKAKPVEVARQSEIVIDVPEPPAQSAPANKPTAKNAPARDATKPEQMTPEAVKVGESAPALDLITRLEAIRDKFDASGDMGRSMSLPHPDAFKSIGKSVIYTALDIAVGALKAGRAVKAVDAVKARRAVKEAIDLALTYLRKNAQGFNEQQVRANLNYLVANEAKPAAVPSGTTPPRSSLPASPGPKVPAGAAAGTGAKVGAGKPSATPTLDDIYAIFEPAKPQRKSLGEIGGQALEAVRTGVSSQLRPLNRLAEDIAKPTGGIPKDLAGKFEQLKGSSGKAQADVTRFDRDVSSTIKGSEKDFSPYVFLRRSLDRLKQDALDIQKALAGGNVPKLNRRAVSKYIIPELEGKLAALEAKLGPDAVVKFEKAADAYQLHMDEALRLQVESGRMAPEMYESIKDGNQFYAPFKLMRYLEDSSKPAGSGRPVDTTASYVKAMEGIESPDFKLGEMLAAGRQNIAMSRVLAEKNRAMRHLQELSSLDPGGLHIRKLARDQDAPKGMAPVNVLDRGKPVRYAVPETVANAIQGLEPAAANAFVRVVTSIFRATATTLNVGFQASNLLADIPRQALVSKYGVQIVPDALLYPIDAIMAKVKGKPGGVKAVNENLLKSAAHSLKYPISILEGFYTAMLGEVGGVRNKLMLDFLDSGVAGTSLQEYLTPGALRGTTKPDSIGGRIAKLPLNLANAVEQTGKVTGVRRAMEQTGSRTGKELAQNFPEAITEIRRFSGSPDFGRMGKWVQKYGLNVLEPFLNARIQGSVADLGRLAGRDGARRAAATWINMAAFVGMPTLMLYLHNHKTKELSDAFDSQRPDREKRDYWLIPKTDKDGNVRYITGANGEKMVDYNRVPKREVSKWTANFIEAGMDFARKKDPQAFYDWAGTAAEDMFPINVQGNTGQERMESVAAGLNPLIKVPAEVAFNRDFYRHRELVSDRMQKASPEEQYSERTEKVFKDLAKLMPDVAPQMFRSPILLEQMVKGFTASALTQFIPKQPVEGRTKRENNPLLQRFQAVPYSDSSTFDEKLKTYERDSADSQLKRFRTADTFMKAHQRDGLDAFQAALKREHGNDERLVERIVDLKVAERAGVTPQDRRILNLPVEQRAKFLADELGSASREKREQLLENYIQKRILTESVADEMVRIGFKK